MPAPRAALPLFLLAALSACAAETPCYGDPAAGDTDKDGRCDDADPCPVDPSDDGDGDGSCDADDVCAGDDRTGDPDGDGLCDDVDPCPLDAEPDADADGMCNAVDLCDGHDAAGDADHDGLCEDVDPCLGTGADADADGLCDDRDACPDDAPDDSDADGSCDADDLCIGDDRDGDGDGDGLCDGLDPCPALPEVPATCAAPPPGLAHLWTADGHARDVVGGADATLFGGISTAVPGRVHRAFEIGHGSPTGRVVLPADVADGALDFTVAMWVRTADEGFGLLSAAGDRSTKELLLFPSAEGIDVHLAGDSHRVEAEVADLAWHHLALTRDGTSGALTLYLDGVAFPAVDAATGALQVEALLLGQDQESRQMQGRVDELAWFDRVLSATEVAALGEEELCPDDVAWRDGGDLPLCPSVWHVDPAWPAAAGDGTSWNTPLASLAAAADLARPGDEVRVAAGDSVAVDTAVAAPADVAWFGGFQEQDHPDDRGTAKTRLVVSAPHAFVAGRWATFDGFEVTQGDSPAASPGGRAVHAPDAPVVVRHLEATGLTATDGAAVDAGAVRIEDSRFTSGVASGEGGAVRAVRAVVEDSEVALCSALVGGAIRTTGRLTLRRSRLVDNSATLAPTFAAHDARVEESWVAGNTSDTHALGLADGDLAIHRSTFVDNEGSVPGVGLAVQGHLQAVDSTFVGNTATGPLFDTTSTLLLNSTIADNEAELLALGGNVELWHVTLHANDLTEPPFSGSASLHATVHDVPGLSCVSCCAPDGTVVGGTVLDRADLDLDGVDELYLPGDSACRDAGTVAESDDAPLLLPGWWATRTTSRDQSLDAGAPDFGRHYRPLVP